MSFETLRFALLLCVTFVLGCDSRPEYRSPDPQLLATDVYVNVAQHSLVLPFIALEDHAPGEASFSLDRAADWKRAAARRTTLLRETRDRRNPLSLDAISVAMYPYGATDFDRSAAQLCPRLSRYWARAVCNDSQYSIRHVLPRSRFKLVDLGRFRLDDPNTPINCLPDRTRATVPSASGLTVLLCPALVYGGDEDEFHVAAMRIDSDLGAMWTVWRNDPGGESAEEMAVREGKAITLFVEAALGDREDYTRLLEGMQTLRRPEP